MRHFEILLGNTILIIFQIMCERYIESLIEETKYFCDPFSFKKFTQDEMFFPISLNPPATLNFSDYYNHMINDYNLDLYTSVDFSIISQNNPKNIINNGSTYILGNKIDYGIIVGMNGVGKSTFLKQLVYFHSILDPKSPNFKFPILLEIGNLDFSSAKSLKKSIFSGKKFLQSQKTVLFIDGMSENVSNFSKFFLDFSGCFFVTSYKNFIKLPNFSVFFLEPLSVPLQISRAQQILTPSCFLEYIERATCPNSQITEFCRVPFFHSYFLSNFDRLKNHNKANLYYSFLKYSVKRSDLWEELEALACELIEKEITIFGFHEIRCLGHSNKWENIKELAIFEKSDPPAYFSLEESCSDIENEFVLNTLSVKDSVTEFSVTSDCHMLRFLHIRLIEILAAQFYLNTVEDLMACINKSTYIESCEFQLVFSKAFPQNFWFSRKYREILILFSQICHENLFENLVKYLISFNAVEYVYVAEKILKNCNSHIFQHLENKISNQKQELYMKEFLQGLTHISPVIRNLCKNQLFSIAAPVRKLISGKTSVILKNCNWFMLSSFKTLAEYIQIDEIYSCISLEISTILDSIQSHQIYACSYLNVLLKIFIRCIEKSRHNSSTTLSPSKTEEHLVDENTLRTSLESIRICRTDLKDSVQGFSKIEKKLLEGLIKVKGINVKSIVKALIGINSKKKIVKTCLVQRAKIYEGDSKNILESLSVLKASDKDSLEFIINCYLDKETRVYSKEILKNVDSGKLKDISNELLQRNVCEGILALGFCCKYEIENEIIEQLIQYIDNSDAYMSYLGVISLNNILKPIDSIFSQQTLNILAILSEIINDRTQLIKNIEEIYKKYLKCELRLLKVVGNYKKIVEICEKNLQNEGPSICTLVYKYLFKLSVYPRYFDKFSRFLCTEKFGVQGKYLLKIAENNLSWRNESFLNQIILDKTGRFKAKNIASLLEKWDNVLILENFCNVENCESLQKISEILQCLEKSEYPQIFAKFQQAIAQIESNFFELLEQHGLIIPKILANNGKKSEWFKEWLFENLLDCGDFCTFERLSATWGDFENGPVVNIPLESKLIDYFQNYREKSIKIAMVLHLKSDKFLLMIVPLFLNSVLSIETFESVFLSLLQLKTSEVLVSLYKLIYFTNPDPEFTYKLHMCVNKIIKKIVVKNDLELEIFLEAACKFNCSLYFEHIWKYLLGKVNTNPRYFITDSAENILLSYLPWDSKFSIKFCRILGLLRVKKSCEEFTQAIVTHKLNRN